MSDPAGRALRMAYVVAGVCGVAFFVLSVGLLGVWPARVLDAETRAMAPPHPLEPTTSERRGRAVYVREGCGYCHTQQIRYLPADRARFGAPTLAWETRRDTPHLLGTRRIGPDLSRSADTRSADWHFAHLYAPRAIVAGSVMPAFPSLFDGGADRPRQDARDLVAYLESLGRARQLAGPEGDAHAREACNCADDHHRLLAFGGPLNAHPGQARRAESLPASLPAAPGDVARGRELYGQHCASCHGATGAGDGPGAQWLLPAPANLAAHAYSTPRLAEILWNGVAGSAMPAWRDRTAADLADITAAVQALGDTRPEPAVPDHLVPIGAAVYSTHCVQCHGERGDGRGSAADSLAMVPASFRGQRISLAEAVRVLRDGIPGTPMAPWTTRLTDAERLAVAHHVRGFFDAPAGPAQAVGR